MQQQEEIQEEKTEKKSIWNKKFGCSSCLVIVVGTIFFLVVYFLYGTSVEEKDRKSAEKSSQTIETTKEEATNYEIVDKSFKGNTKNITVFTLEKDDQKLVSINDKLVSENKEDNVNLFINYFDDKELTKTYFQKMVDEEISESAKDEMFKHYIANMKYNVFSGYKAFNKNQDNNWVEIKKY